jgi:hypothetical protein
MPLLAALLLLDAVLHALVIVRHGTQDKANMPFLIFMVVDAVLAAAVFWHLPFSLWATLLLSIFGIIGLTVTFNKPQREKSLDKAIWAVDLIVVIAAGYLLFAG